MTALDRLRAIAGDDVSRETLERLETYQTLVEKWTRTINLVSKPSLAAFWERHILDSAQLWPHRPAHARRWLDLGSGGGLPGLVIACLATDRSEPLQVTLVESDLRKSAFLQTAAQQLGVAVAVRTERIEALRPMGADVVSARALAPLPTLLGFAELHLAPGGVALFPKGATYRREVEAALASWRFASETLPSKTEPEAVILKIGDVARV